MDAAAIAATAGIGAVPRLVTVSFRRILPALAPAAGITWGGGVTGNGTAARGFPGVTGRSLIRISRSPQSLHHPWT